MRYHGFAAIAAMMSVAACSDGTQGTTGLATIEPASAELSQSMFRNGVGSPTGYVAIGTSVSMGWMDDGVIGSSQARSWTKQLADGAGVPFDVPSIDAPGCKPPLAAPLITFKRIDGSSAGESTVCAPNAAGVTLPTNNLAVENATAGEALNATPETASAGRGPVTSRVLPSGMTQVTAMRSLNPLFVSVELGGNELLPAQVGIIAPGVTVVPFETFKANYDRIIDEVKASHARAVLVSLRTDLRNFPTIRTSPEIAAQRAAFAAYNVRVSTDCDAGENFVFVRGKVVTAIATGAAMAGMGLGPYVLSCADQPGKADYILTPADIEYLNALGEQMSDEIERQAAKHRYAVFSLGELYNSSKDGVPFELEAFLKSSTPYGPKISLDGVHPNEAGHAVLAAAARREIIATYLRRFD